MTGCAAPVQGTGLSADLSSFPQGVYLPAEICEVRGKGFSPASAFSLWPKFQCMGRVWTCMVCVRECPRRPGPRAECGQRVSPCGVHPAGLLLD